MSETLLSTAARTQPKAYLGLNKDHGFMKFIVRNQFERLEYAKSLKETQNLKWRVYRSQSTLDEESNTNTQFDEPTFKITPVPLNRLAEHTGHLVDVLAVVDRVGDLTQVTTRKDSRQLDKQDIFLVDESGVEVALTLWGDKATNFDVSSVGKVIGVKGVSVREFNGGLSLSPSMNYFEIKYNPEGEEANRLYFWYSKKRSKTDIKIVSSSSEMSSSFDRDFKPIGLAIKHRIGRESDCGVYFNVKAMIVSIRTKNAFYRACPTDGCRKKLISENGVYRCDKCNATYDKFQNIVMLTVELADFSGTAWATIFDDKATALLGVTGDKMAELFREDTAQYEALFDKIRFREFNIRVRVKYEMYNNHQQMKWTIFDLKSVPEDSYYMFGNACKIREFLVGAGNS